MHGETKELRDRVDSLAVREGLTEIPPLGLFRFTRRATFRKTPSFGVTLGVVLRGEKRIRIGRESIVVDPTRLVVITREIEYGSDIVPGAEGPYLGVSLGFSPESVAHALVMLAERSTARTSERIPAFVTAIDRDVVAALGRISRASEDPLDARILVPLASQEILHRLLRSEAAIALRASVGAAPDSARILDAMRLVRDESERELSVQRLARRVGMSPSHFAHRFRAIARVSPMRYVREVRLERARLLLAEPGSRAGEIASRVGFASASHFTREFKRRFGAPPSSFQT